MTRTIGIGVIGMGWMGEVHSRSYRAIPDRFPDSGFQPRLVICADPVEASGPLGPGRVDGQQPRLASISSVRSQWVGNHRRQSRVPTLLARQG